MRLHHQRCFAARHKAFESVLVRAAGSSSNVYVRLTDLPRELRDWLSVSRRAREFGAVFLDEDGWRYYLMLEAFDAAIVLRSVEPTTPTQTGVEMAKPPP